MALAATVVFEVQSGGADGNSGNGGGFDPVSGIPGTDLSTGAPIALTSLSIDATTNTKMTCGSRAFTASDVGNLVAIASGTGFTVQRVQILSVSSGVATCDKSLGTLSSTGGAGNIGGPLASPGQAGALMVAGNDLHIKAATYSVTSASSNVAGGCLTLPAGASNSNWTNVYGYQTTRGDNGTKPLIQASGIATFTLVTMAAQTTIQNVSIDGATLTSSRGLNAGFVCQVIRCKVANCTNNAILGSGISSSVLFCEITGCTTAAACNGGSYFYCYSHANTVPGFSTGSTGIFVGNVSASNTGVSSDGFQTGGTNHLFIGNLAYANGRDGFRVTAGASQETFINNLAANHAAGWGFNATAAVEGVVMLNNATYLNNSGTVNTTSALPSAGNLGFVALSASPFRNAGTDFSLNNVSGGGKSLRWAGVPASSGVWMLPGLTGTPAYADIGAAQHKDRIRGWFGGQR